MNQNMSGDDDGTGSVIGAVLTSTSQLLATGHAEDIAMMKPTGNAGAPVRRLSRRDTVI